MNYVRPKVKYDDQYPRRVMLVATATRLIKYQRPNACLHAKVKMENFYPLILFVYQGIVHLTCLLFFALWREMN